MWGYYCSAVWTIGRNAIYIWSWTNHLNFTSSGVWASMFSVLGDKRQFWRNLKVIHELWLWKPTTRLWCLFSTWIGTRSWICFGNFINRWRSWNRILISYDYIDDNWRGVVNWEKMCLDAWWTIQFSEWYPNSWRNIISCHGPTIWWIFLGRDRSVQIQQWVQRFKLWYWRTRYLWLCHIAEFWWGLIHCREYWE